MDYKKIAAFVLISVSVNFLAAVRASAADGQSGHSLSLGVSSGVLAGKSEEIVYYNSTSENKLSQLLWEMKPLLYAGINAGYSWQMPSSPVGFFAGLSFKAGLPVKTGSMEDRDWMYENADGVHYPNWLTHYSVHDNKTESAMLIDFAAGSSFPLGGAFLLKGFLAYSYMHFSWAASRGSLLYPDGHFYLLSPEDAVTYEQDWHIFYIGLSLYGRFNRYFSIEPFFKFSPLVWVDTLDGHLRRSLIIKNELSGGFGLEPGLCFSFTPVPSPWSLSFSFSYRRVKGPRGDSSYSYTDNSIPETTYQDIGGAGYSVFDIGLSVQYWLF